MNATKVPQQMEAIKILRPGKIEKTKYADIVDWIVKNLHGDRFSKIQLELLFELGCAAKGSTQVLFYPSSGDDINDIIAVDVLRNHQQGNNVPKIFIHNDASDYEVQNILERLALYPDRLTVKGNAEYTLNNEVRIYIVKIERSNRELCWLVQICNQDNEDTLKLFLTHGWKIKYLYSVCDGIHHGMGGPRNRQRDQSIPPLLYAYLAETLNCRFHFSDFPISYLSDLYVEENRTWFENLLEFIDFLPTALKEHIRNKMGLDINTFCGEFNCNPLHVEGLIYQNYEMYLISRYQ